MRRFAVPHALGALVLTLSLAGCGGKADQENASALASLDTRLTNDAAALANGADAAKGVPDAAPVARGDAVLAAHNAIVTADADNASAAAAGKDGGEGKGAVSTLASVAGKRVGGCAGGDMRYGDKWVAAMPQGIALYPGAHLVEAAGADTGRCALRAMSFTTADSPEAVATHYASRVREAGFDAERLPCKTEIRMGGVRKGDDAAYMLFARRTAKGLTEVDIVASAGPA